MIEDNLLNNLRQIKVLLFLIIISIIVSIFTSREIVIKLKRNKQPETINVIDLPELEPEPQIVPDIKLREEEIFIPGIPENINTIER